MNSIKNFIGSNKDKKILIFTETKKEANDFGEFKFAKFMPIHGDMSQSQRERSLANFKGQGTDYILVATDVAARGLDVDDIDIVIQCGCRDFDSFVHRAGRTARKGKQGLNVLLLEYEKMHFAFDLRRKLNLEIEIRNSF